MRLLVYLFLALTLVDGTCLAEAPAARPYTRNVAIVLYEGVEILDFGGPSEVFQAAGGFARSGGERAFRVYTMAANDKPVISQGFIKVQPEFTIANAPKPDIIVIPGGNSSNLTDNPQFMAWARKAIAESEVTLTVCTGAFVLGRLGLLDGLDATTYYGAIEHLRQETPKARIHNGRRFIDQGRYVTTAGVSAGIDGSLHVIARLLGRMTAEKTAQYMEYRWTPETYIASSYDVFNPSLDETGRAMQRADIDLQGKRYENAAQVYRAILAQNPDHPAALYSLGITLAELKAYPEAAAALIKASSAPQLRADALFNAACVYARAGQKKEALDALGGAVKAGFKQKGMIVTDPDLASLRAEARFQEIVGSL